MTPGTCWCGHDRLEPWNAEYRRCPACETLVLADPSPTLGRVDDEQRDFYSRDYWFAHQQDMGLPTIVDRSRRDLVDRVPDWLQTLLRFRLPPARTLELGCSHGAFVGLARAAGFDAVGLELSAAIAELARRSFDIPVLVGPLEEQHLPPASLDVVIAMDVLEHLLGPLSTLSAVAAVAAPGAVLMFQTPRYPEGASFAELQAAASPFLAMLLPQEHTFLFSERSVTQLLARVGFAHVTFPPAVFAQYDMCVVAGRSALVENAPEAQQAALLATPRGRLAQALLDARGEEQRLHATLAQRSAELDAVSAGVGAAEADREARLAVIEQQGAELGAQQARVAQLEAEVTALRQHLDAAEQDRAARLAVITEQSERLAAASARLGEVEAEAAALHGHLAACEADRAARLAVIEEQGRALAARESEAAALRDRVGALERWAREVDGTWVGRVLRRLTQRPGAPGQRS